MGNEWRTGLGSQLRLRRVFPFRGMVLSWVDGSRYTFATKAGQKENSSQRTFEAAPGMPARLAFRPPSDPDGEGYTLTFDKTGTKYLFDNAEDGYETRLIKVLDRNGNALSLSYTGSEKLAAIKNSQNEQLTATYNTDGTRLTKYTDWTGRDWKYAYAGEGGRLSSYTDPENKTTSYEYVGAGQPGHLALKLITDPLGHKTRITYTSEGRVASVTRQVDGTTGNDVTTTYAYSQPTSPCSATDGHSRKTIVTNARGHSATYCSNYKSQVVVAYDAQANKTESSYTPNGDVSELSENFGGSASSASKINYDLDGTDPTNNVTDGKAPGQAQFSINYRPTSSDPLDRFRANKTTSPDGTQEFYDYDAKGNVTMVGDSASAPANKANLSYHPNGLIATATDGRSNVTTYGQSDGNITSVTPPAPLGATTLTYDALNRVKTVTDGKSQTRTLTYDKLDRVTRVDLSDSTWTASTFDAVGNQLTRTSSSSANSTFAYDELNRRVIETNPGSRTASYVYDKAGNLVSLTDPAGLVTYNYDTLNRVTSITQPGSRTTTRGYAHVDLPGSDTDPSVPDIDALDVTTTYPTGYKDVRRINAAGDIDRIEWKTGTVTERRLSYAYGGTPGNATPLLAELQDESPAGTTKKLQAYEYDPLGRLEAIGTLDPANPAAETLVTHTYDNASNRVQTLTEYPGSTAASTSVYRKFQPSNALCWTAPAASTNACGTVPTGGTGYLYDPNGNRTSSTDSKSYSYDILDRLTSLNGSALTYLSPTNSEINTLGSTAQQSNLTGIGRIGTTAYTRTSDGELLSQRPATGEPAYILTDRLGSTIGVLENNNVTRRYDYTPDGTDTTTGTGSQIPFRYVGGQKTGELTHFAARYYDPAAGQWTQQDPLNQVASLQEANRYSYVAGDPVNRTDMQGLAGSLGGCSFGPASVSGSRDDGSKDSGASFGVGLGPSAGCSGSRYGGTTGKGVSADTEACLIVCGGYNTDSGLRLGLGVKVGVSIGLSLDI